jgi:hypothetical protein
LRGVQLSTLLADIVLSARLSEVKARICWKRVSGTACLIG